MCMCVKEEEEVKVYLFAMLQARLKRSYIGLIALTFAFEVSIIF